MIDSPRTTKALPRNPETKEQKLLITFRGGHKGVYTARQLRWGDTGHAFDVVDWRAA